MSDRTKPRELNLVWNGVEWADDRCGCRYHPDDQNMSHGGGPHVHQCERHKQAHHDRIARAALERARDAIRDAPHEAADHDGRMFAVRIIRALLAELEGK